VTEAEAQNQAIELDLKRLEIVTNGLAGLTVVLFLL